MSQNAYKSITETIHFLQTSTENPTSYVKCLITDR